MKNTAENNHYDIVVVGGGMIGSIAAGLFSKHGFSVALLDQKPAVNLTTDNSNPRVSALNLASQKILAHLDCWEAIAETAQPYQHMHVWEHENQNNIAFHSSNYMQSQLGFIVKNDAVVTTLTKKIEQNFNAQLFHNTALENKKIHADGITLKLNNNKTLTCQLLVGADGAHSNTRQLLGIAGDFSDYHQRAIVCQIETENPHDNTAWQCFLPNGPVALLPMTKKNCYSIVWSSDNNFAQEVLAWDESVFCKQLSHYISNKTGRVKSVSDRVSFPLTQYHAQRYIAERSVIIGDAAHTLHPLAGLSANASIIDVATLVEVIANSKANNKDFSGHTTLRRYQRWRHSENIVLIKFVDAIKYLFATQSPSLKNLRNRGLTMVDNTPIIKKLFAHSAMGMIGDLPKICQTNNS